jgi:hypothetical protein
MTGKRFLTLVFGLVGVLALGATPAGADPPVVPPYDGASWFPTIQDPSGPEEFPRRVELGKEQELRAIDDQSAAVYSDGTHVAFWIQAMPAHDATGASVPTSLAVSAGDIVTLTVHHRAGNPAASGASFDYPINAGTGWEGGFVTVVVPAPPGEFPPEPWLGCTVPKLTGYTLRADRRRLQNAGCTLGVARGHRAPNGFVFKQHPSPGSKRALGALVNVRVAG